MRFVSGSPDHASVDGGMRIVSVALAEVATGKKGFKPTFDPQIAPGAPFGTPVFVTDDIALAEYSARVLIVGPTAPIYYVVNAAGVPVDLAVIDGLTNGFWGVQLVVVVNGTTDIP
jgi:hypothetical protein